MIVVLLINCCQTMELSFPPPPPSPCVGVTFMLMCNYTALGTTTDLRDAARKGACCLRSHKRNFLVCVFRSGCLKMVCVDVQTEVWQFNFFPRFFSPLFFFSSSWWITYEAPGVGEENMSAIKIWDTDLMSIMNLYDFCPSPQTW